MGDRLGIPGAVDFLFFSWLHRPHDQNHTATAVNACKRLL